MAEEIRVKVSGKMDEILTKISENMGVKKTEYVKSLIVKDLRKRGGRSG